MFAILYCKIVDKKKKGIELEGPFLGPECETLSLAHEKASEITNSSKDIILVRIYNLEEYSYEEAKEIASNCFKGIYDNMLSAASILERPSSKSRRRKKAKSKAQ